jgi:hypothetical protein
MPHMNEPSLSAARLVLVQRRDTVAPRDPRAAKVRRYRLARVALAAPRPAAPGPPHLRRVRD